MEYRKNYGTPRDMVDDALLAQLLGESEMSCSLYGCAAQRRSGNSCTCYNKQMNGHGNNACQMSRYDHKYDCDQKDTSMDCDCDDHESCAAQNCLSGYPLAMAYIPDHEWDNLHDVEDALGHGTVFKGLDFPFYPACKSCR